MSQIPIDFTRAKPGHTVRKQLYYINHVPQLALSMFDDFTELVYLYTDFSCRDLSRNAHFGNLRNMYISHINEKE